MQRIIYTKMTKDIITIILLSGTIFTLSCVSLALICYVYYAQHNRVNGQSDAESDIEIPRVTFCVSSEPAANDINTLAKPPIEVEANRNNILCLDTVDVSVVVITDELENVPDSEGGITSRLIDI